MPQERKIVTVLFADIVDSSGTTRSYDAEVLRAALGRTFAQTRETLVAHGATVEKFIGDAVMAVFGVPAAHEDDAERAVKAGMAIRAAVSSTGGEGRPGFTLRIGINTGEVVTGDSDGAEFLVTGGPVIVAARLEQSAQPGEILVGPLTRQLTRGRITYGPSRVVETKGMGPIEAAPAVGVFARSPMEPSQAASPFVGREAELGLLSEIYRRVGRSGRPHLVTVYADAGIGKSRLASEFLLRLGSEPWARVACPPYGNGITYWPLQELIRVEAGITPTDSRDAAKGKIESRVGAIVDRDEVEARAIARELTALALADERVAPTDLSSDGRRRELALGMARYLEARLKTAPAAVVIEDLHWAEEPMLALLEEMLEHLRAPFLLLCLGRPEVLVRRPTWGSGRNAMALTLEALDEEETAQLARALLEDRADERVAEIVSRTEGNPLFVEEYVRILVDQGSGAVVPPTLHGVIAARLDATTPSTKRLIQEASVCGRDFWLDALPGAATRAESEAADLDEAQRRGLVGRTGRRGPSGSQTFAFRHGLIRDVAYASLSKAERTKVHDHYARWLETTAGERALEYAEIIAYHAERAFQTAHELDDPRVTELGRRAFALLSRCAAAASSRGEFRGARELNDRALAVAEAGGLPVVERAGADALSAIIKLRLESDSSSIGALDQAIAAARAIGPSDDLVRLLIWRASSVTIFDDLPASEDLFAEAVAAARKTGDPGMIAYAVWASSEPVGVTGRLDDQAKLLADALAQIRAAGSEQWEVSCLAEIALNELERGEVDLARSHAQEAVELARRSGRRLDAFKAAEAWARVLLARNNTQARAAAEEALALAREIGGPGPLARAAETAARAREQAGDKDGALELLEEVLDKLDATRMPTHREAIARLEATRSAVALSRGDRKTARASAETAMRIAPPTNVAAQAIAELAAVSVALAAQRLDDAQRLIEHAQSVLKPTQYRALRQRADGLAREIAEGVSNARRSPAR
ncbi:MAG TPA: adenylate/guanylate cyclase domain-containing protein [Candidatus Limnocylindria bacterium]|nr:adenylate/guanylate cyclase domain-containing protein [Candidatus Limnocylindria bacterium]